MKIRMISLTLCAVLALALAACGTAGDGHTVYLRDTYGHDAMTAEFYSTTSDDTLTTEMQKVGEEGDSIVYRCAADPETYDRVVFTYDDTSTEELSFNRYVSGWELDSYRFYPFTYGTEDTDPVYKRQSFPYENRTKDILIWVPDDYDPTAEDKYSVLYMTDGQNLFQRTATSTGSWAVAESAQAMMSQSDNRLIIVGIENADGFRDSELTPDIGTVLAEDYEDGRGAYFCDFVVDTVMPYIEENYNVYTDREHTGICGSSSGGIESFYIAMEHPERFGTVGALSPAFMLYSDKTWEKYLSGRDFSAGYPFVYIYNGAASSDILERSLLPGAQIMPRTLKSVGYPEDKVALKVYDNGLHNEMYWRAVFPDYLKYMFPLNAE